jgi:hypothetical protein
LGEVRRSEVAAAVFAAIPPQVLKPIVSNQGVYLNIRGGDSAAVTYGTTTKGDFSGFV